MRFIIFIFFWFVSSPFIKAQVKGVIVDERREPVAGANVYWLNTTKGTTTDFEGSFTLERTTESSRLVSSFIGYESDTLSVPTELSLPLVIVLKSNAELEEVNVVGRKVGLTKMRATVFNTDMINQAELYRAACCNLGESFVTNPSVDVTYSDAATGAKQIRLLGLSGNYVQMLTENIPNFRGAASPYGLGYIPGPWMQSIQVSKGTSSVKNGYEAIAGQINVEYKKPQTSDIVSVNLFAATSGRYEANADVSLLVNDNLSTMLFAHYENENGGHDKNDDGFMDYPSVEQYNLFNRWAYTKGKYLLLAGLKGLKEERKGGQMHSMENPYKIHLETDRYEGFLKNAYGINPERSSSIALMLSGSIHKQDSYFGNKTYKLNQKNGYASLLFETDFTKPHNLSAGLSFNYDGLEQNYRIGKDERYFEKEAVSGAYAQYTFNKEEKLVIMAGLRADYSSKYNWFVTPRVHLKYAPNDYINLRASTGKGYKTNYVLAENNYLLASNRNLVIENDLKQEEAWNYGVSASSYIPVAGKVLNLNVEYYYTNFLEQLVVDMDTDAASHKIHFTNLDGRSYSQSFQVDASYPFFRGFTLTAAYRITDVKTTYGGVLRQKPLTSKYKGLLTASYQTPLGLWQFDATLQLNGKGRMPLPYSLPDGSDSWELNYKGFEQLSAQVTRYFRRWSIYVGGENLTNFTQKRTIIGASDPWGENFDSTMIWGPVHGIKGYVGIRFNLPRI